MTRRGCLLSFIVLSSFLRTLALAQDILPTETPGPLTAEVSTAGEPSLSLPGAAPDPTAPSSALPTPSEREKAPAPEKPSAVPEFSLPEVVITGRNELTIGAQRPDPKEENVTMGSRELSAFDRSLDDLPGLSKTLTGLSTEDDDARLDSSLVLRYGGGIPGTHGGWALMGHDFGGAQLLLSGNRSVWGGEEVLGGRTADERWGAEGTLRFPLGNALKALLSGGTFWRGADLPQFGMEERRQGTLLGGTFQWKLSNLLQAQGKVSYRSTVLDVWDLGMKHGDFQETEASLKVTADETGELLNRVSVEMGGRRASYDGPAMTWEGYDWGWLGVQGLLKRGEGLSLLAKAQFQAGTGPDLDPAVFPSLAFTWRVFESTQWTLHWGKDRFVEDLQGVFGKTLHSSFRGGFPLPVEGQGEWGTRFTQKVGEDLVLSLSASHGEWRNFHQWTDLDPSLPWKVQGYSTLPKVALSRAGGGLQWNFTKDWQASASYQWAQGEDLSGGGAAFTGLPTHRGTFSLYRGDDSWEVRTELSGVSTRRKFETLPGLLPSYLTLGLDATWHLTRTFSLWFNGDNLLGEDYELQPGYPEPRFHLRAGAEVIF